MKILAIDSSGMPASAAIVEDGMLVAEYTVHYKKTHSQTLLPMIDEISRMTMLDKSTLDAIAVAGGPGSFTGLRIGSATAKGIGLALDIPIVNVPTLEALAANYHGSEDLICPMLDARRSEVFAGIYTYEEDPEAVIADGMSMRVLMDQAPLPAEKLCGKLNFLYEQTGKKAVLLGDGAAAYRELLDRYLLCPHMYAPANLCEQHASSAAVRAEEMLSMGKTETAAEHRPIYLRVSQAERVRAEKIKEPGTRAGKGEDAPAEGA